MNKTLKAALDQLHEAVSGGNINTREVDKLMRLRDKELEAEPDTCAHEFTMDEEFFADDCNNKKLTVIVKCVKCAADGEVSVTPADVEWDT